MYDEFGFPSPHGVPNTPADVFEIGAAYYAESTSLREDVRKEMVASSLNGIYRERARSSRTTCRSATP